MSHQRWPTVHLHTTKDWRPSVALIPLQLIVFSAPENERAAVMDVISGHGLTPDWGISHAHPNSRALRLGECYSTRHAPLGTSSKDGTLYRSNGTGTGLLKERVKVFSGWGAQLNARAKPWTWSRPTPPTRRLHRRSVYSL
ncbi:hypothetical protein ABZ208_32965 [Streptomyces sp. NPDC006208]|uniref:hypothetical protein n=1 Tax=Streptomyces sp. NPDC006208 TaxID=3156734 RepID=UPI0033BBDD4B